MLVKANWVAGCLRVVKQPKQSPSDQSASNSTGDDVTRAAGVSSGVLERLET